MCGNAGKEDINMYEVLAATVVFVLRGTWSNCNTPANSRLTAALKIGATYRVFSDIMSVA